MLYFLVSDCYYINHKLVSNISLEVGFNERIDSNSYHERSHNEDHSINAFIVVGRLDCWGVESNTRGI